VSSAFTCSSVIFRGALGWGASASASIRHSMNRTRHLRTVSRDTPVRPATRQRRDSDSSAQASTTCARSASDRDWTSFGLGTLQAYNLQTYL